MSRPVSSGPSNQSPMHKMVCSNFQDLKPKPRESVCLYFTQNMETFKRFMPSKSNNMLQAIWADYEQKKIWDDAEVTLDRTA